MPEIFLLLKPPEAAGGIETIDESSLLESMWPTPQDYNEAIQSPATCFADPDLKNGHVETNAIGLPRARTGAFASVYKVTNHDKSWAVRCFLTSRLDQKDRYRLISNFVLFDDLECTIDFHYIDEGIKVKGHWYPLLKMPWVDGETLDQFLYKNYKTPGAVKDLLAEFHDMVAELENAGIGHGDLQHGNIIKTNKGLRLVDYDALFVPALAGKKSLELGHPNYQHPERNEHHYNPDVDNFSCWLIHTALLILAIDPDLYDRFEGHDDCMLFRRKDLLDPENSQLFQTLLTHESDSIRQATTLIERMLWAAPSAIPILDAPEEHLALLPTVRTEQAKAPSSAQEATDVSTPEATISQEAVYEKSPARIQGETTSKNRYDFLDHEAANLKSSNKRKQLQRKTLIEKFQNYTDKMLTSWAITLAPNEWVSVQLKQARKFFNDGEYARAEQIYLDSYKLLEPKQADDTSISENLFESLMGLGYCSAFSGKLLVGGNYFLLAYKRSGADTSRLRAAVCLALAKFESNDEEEAMKLLSENSGKSPAMLANAIRYELKSNVYFNRNSSFHMLRKLAEFNPARAKEAKSAALNVFKSLASSNSLKLTDEEALSLLQIGEQSKDESQSSEAHRQFQEIGELLAKSGSVKQACLFLFCSSACSVTVSDTANIRTLNNKNWLINEFKNNRECLKPWVETALEHASPQSVQMALTQLSVDLVAAEEAQAASVALRCACSIAVHPNSLKLDELLANTICKLEDREMWYCLSDTYLETLETVEKFIYDFGDPKYERVLSVAAQGLAHAGKTNELESLFTHLALWSDPFILKNICQRFVSCKTDADRKNQAVVVKALLTCSDNVTDRLEAVVNSKNLASDGPGAHLIAIDAISGILKSMGRNSEAKQSQAIFLRPQYTPYIMSWLNSLLETGDFQRLNEVLFDLVDDVYLPEVPEIILRMSIAKVPGGLETLIAKLKNGGVKKATLEKLLLPAAERTLVLIKKMLDSLTFDASGESKIDSWKKLEDAVLRASDNLKALYRLRALMRECAIEDPLTDRVRFVYQHRHSMELAVWARTFADQEELDLLASMARDLALWNRPVLEKLLTKLANEQKERPIFVICKSLLANNQAPALVSLAKDISKQNPALDFFNALTMQIVRDSTDEEIVSLSNELRDQDCEEAVAHLIRQLRLFNRFDILFHLLPLLQEDERNQDGDKLNDAFSSNDPSSTVKYAEELHLAAVGGDRNLANRLESLERTGVPQDDIRLAIREAMRLCRVSLRSILEQTASSVTSKKDQLLELANLRMSEFIRLFPLLQDTVERKVAAKAFFKECHSEFFIRWILELAIEKDFDELSTLAMMAAQSDSSILEDIFLTLAANHHQRALIIASRKLCEADLADKLIPIVGHLVKGSLNDAFGTVCLEIVTTTSDDRILKDLLQCVGETKPELTKVLKKQIVFYRSKLTYEAVMSELQRGA